MQLVEQHIIKDNDKYYKECDELCFKTKNLYNSCLYILRQEWIKNKVNVLSKLYHLIKTSKEYKELPAKVSSSVIIMINLNFKSFFKALESYNKYPHLFKDRPRLPRYLDKIDGRFITSYTNQAISKKVFKKTNKIKLSQSNIEFKTKIDNFEIIDCVRIVPKIGYYVVELVYTIEDTPKLENNNKYMAIDLGINNLATLTSNDINFNPMIINGKPLKSMNQFYNKKQAEISSVLEIRNNSKKSKKLNKLALKRKNKVDDYLHKSSKKIVEILKLNKINTLVIGKNDNWKQEVDLSKKTNQNFVSIPHSRFIDMLKYKCERNGINYIINEESYTSKASFINLDFIPTYKKGDNTKYEFSGYRESRGIYKIKGSDKKINADVNGSYNILRKAIPNVFADGIEGLGVVPSIIKIEK
ncbi:transposase [Candidatus Dojkabacteria bacterium]|jgi:putative transposase|nr:transposase [Candidatus Dojkabacteria bacterium]